MAQISNESLTELFEGQPLMAILRGFGVERSVSLARTAWELGIDSVEVPIQSDEDVEALRAVASAGKELGKAVGAGTVVTLDLCRGRHRDRSSDGSAGWAHVGEGVPGIHSGHELVRCNARSVPEHAFCRDRRHGCLER